MNLSFCNCILMVNVVTMSWTTLALTVLLATDAAASSTTTIICNSGSGTPPPSVILQNDTTYVVASCTVPVLFTANATALQNVIVISDGSTVLPMICITSSYIRNVSLRISGGVIVGPSSAIAANLPVFSFSQVIAQNIDIFVSNLWIENTNISRLVDISAAQIIDNVRVAVVNCTLINVVTAGLIAIRGAPISSRITITGQALNVSVVGGKFQLVLAPFSNDRGPVGALVQLASLYSLHDVTLSFKDDLRVDVKNRGDAISDVTLLALVSQISIVSEVSILVSSANVTGSLDASAGSLIQAITMSSITFLGNNTVLNIDHSIVSIQAGDVVGVYLTGINSIDHVDVASRNTTWVLRADKAPQLPAASFFPVGVTVVAMSVFSVMRVSAINVSFVDSIVTVYAANTSTPRQFATVSCAAVVWSTVTTTADSFVTILRTVVNVTAREAAVGVAPPFLGAPSLASFSFAVSSFGSFQGAFYNTTIHVKNTVVWADLVIAPPIALPSAVPPLHETGVSIAGVNSNSNWTDSSIVVDQSQVEVRQLRFNVAHGEAYQSVSEAINCSVWYFANTTTLISFRGGAEFLQACFPSTLMAIPLMSSIMNSFALRNYVLRTILSVRDSYVGPASAPASDVAISAPTFAVGSQPYPLFSTALFLPESFMDGLVEVLRVSCRNKSDLSNSRRTTGPILALGGTQLVGNTMRLTLVQNFVGIILSVDASSLIDACTIYADSVEVEGAIMSGNNISVSALTVTLLNATFHSLERNHQMFGHNVQWKSIPGAVSAWLWLQKCNSWNHRPLTLPLLRRLLPNLPETVMIEHEVGIVCEEGTVTPEVYPPVRVVHIPTATAAVGMSTVAMSAASAASIASLTSAVRLQSAFGVMRTARGCAAITSSKNTDGAATTASGSFSSDDVGTAVFDNPLQLSLHISDRGLQFAAGCIVGNSLLVVLAVLVLNVRYMKFLRQSHQKTRGGGIILAMLRDMADRAPGNGVSVMLLLLPPTVTSSVTMTVTPHVHPATAGIGTVCALWFSVGNMVCILLALRCFPLLAAERRALPRPTRMKRLWYWLFGERWRWVVDPHWTRNKPFMCDGGDFMLRFRALFLGYRKGCHWFLMLDVGLPVLNATLNGLAPVDGSSGSGIPATCSWVMWALLAVSVVACVASMVYRPCMTRWDNVWCGISNMLGVVVAVFCVMDDIDTADIITTVFAWVILVPSLILSTQSMKRLMRLWRQGSHDVADLLTRKEDIKTHPSMLWRKRNSGDDTLLGANGCIPVPMANQSPLAMLVELICLPHGSQRQ